MAAELPKFDPKKIYFLKGETINGIITALQINRPCCSDDGGLTLLNQSDDGAFLGTSDEASSGGTSEDPAYQLPEFDDGMVYVLKQETVDLLFKLAQRGLTKVADGSGLTAEYSDQGVALSVAN